MKRYRLEGEPQEAEMVEDKDGEYIKYGDVITLLKSLSNHGHLDVKGANVALDWMVEK